jgi:hypothetical protein
MPQTACYAIALMLLAWAAPTPAQIYGDSVTIDVPAYSDQYLAGGTIRILAPIQGDLVTAGRALIVEGAIAGDLTAAGQTLDVRAPIGDDMRAAARDMSLDHRVAGHLVAAGKQVRLGPNATIGDWAWIAGREVTLNGRIGQELRVVGQRIVVNADIGGDAVLTGEEIRIEADSRIAGDLIIRSDRRPDIAPGAIVRGQIVQRDLPRDPDQDRASSLAARIGGTLFLTLMFALTALLVRALWPRFTRATTAGARTRPLRTLGLGVGFALMTPFAALLLCLSGIGLIAGIGLLGLYVLLLLFAPLAGILMLADLGLQLTGRTDAGSNTVRIMAVVLASALLFVIGAAPAVGTLAWGLLGMMGLGASVAELWRHYRSPGAPA